MEEISINSFYQVCVDVNQNEISVETQVLLFIKLYCGISDSKFIFNKGSSNFIDNLCELPVFIDHFGIIHSGLCNVVRKIISKYREFSHLLGTSGGCLKACAEVSNWTNLIEVDFPNSIRNLALNANNRDATTVLKSENETSKNVYEVFETIENHLNLPPVICNVTKLQHQNNKLQNHNSSNKLIYTRYAEGLDFLLTDLLLFCYISMCFKLDSNIVFIIQNNFPNICKWHNTVLENNISVKNAAEKCGYTLNISEKADIVTIKNFKKGNTNLKVANTSLVYNLKYDIPVPSTKDIEQILLSYDKFNSEFNTLSNAESNNNLFDGFDSIFNDTSYSIFIEDNFPLKRRERKLQQLQNMAAAIMCLSPKRGQVIVDFCCGSGHLGILMAHLLPDCKIILIENKEESLTRAFNQVTKLELQNVTFIRSNIGHFKASFDIGICLHGCGLVTDLVLNKCFAVKANYVVCPCCYGASKDTQYIKYPKSQLFRSISNSSTSFHHILQAADVPISTNTPKDAKSKKIKSVKNMPTIPTNIGFLIKENKTILSNMKSLNTVSNIVKDTRLSKGSIEVLNNRSNDPDISFLNINDETIVFADIGAINNNPNQLNYLNNSKERETILLANDSTSIDSIHVPPYHAINTTKSIKTQLRLESPESLLPPYKFVSNSITMEASLAKICMHVVDMDRQFHAHSLGYLVDIRTMAPTTCTPKNNILIGQFADKL